MIRRLFPGVGLCLALALLVLAACDALPAATLAPAEPTAVREQTGDGKTPAAPEGEKTGLPTTASIEVFFTGAENQARELETSLVASLDSAARSVDMAMYNFNLDAVGESLLAAHARGVSVRIVAESDALDGRWFDRFRSEGIEVVGDGREELMHNKFLIIDEREVWTGSLNLTESGLNTDDNNFIRFVSTQLARRYGAVFEAMFSAGEFGTMRQPSREDPALDVVGVPVEVYFSPEDRPETLLVELVRGARKSVRVLAYSFTSDALAKALRDQAGAGLVVQGVFDESQAGSQGAEYAPLRQAGLDVRLDGNPGLMHSKVLIIDDEIVVSGSYNFTRAANQSNDENLVILFDSRIAAQYSEAFERIYRQSQ